MCHSQTVSETKVQNLASQTDLSTQGQPALSKGFCSLPGSIIHWKWPFVRAFVTYVYTWAPAADLLYACMRDSVCAKLKFFLKKGFLQDSSRRTFYFQKCTCRFGLWASGWLFMLNEMHQNLWMKVLSQIKLSFGEQSWTTGEFWQWGQDVVRKSSWGLWHSLSRLICLGGEWVDLCIINSTVCRSFSVTFSSLWVNQRPSNSLTDAHKQEKGLLKQPKCQTKPYKLKIQKQKPSLRILAKCLEDNNSNVVELPSKSPDHKLKRKCV